MKSLPETLPDETNALQKMVLDYQSTVDQLQEKLTWYEEQFRLLQHQRFGTSSERGVAIFAKACFGHPSPSKRQKLNATAMPSVPRFVLVTTSRPNRGSEHWLQMT